MEVKENVLSDPNLVTHEHYTTYLTEKGKGWVVETDNAIVGFAIIDTTTQNIWALFVLPGYEGKGIGKMLQSAMLNWYFSEHKNTLWLSTSPGTRAEQFYLKTGWKAVGKTQSNEIKFEMTYPVWETTKNKYQ